MNTEDEYAHLATTPLAFFKFRVDKAGKETNPSPLDGLDYCEADTHQVGTSTRGTPNRISVAAYTGDPSYLMGYGAKDPTSAAESMKRENERASFGI